MHITVAKGIILLRNQGVKMAHYLYISFKIIKGTEPLLILMKQELVRRNLDKYTPQFFIRMNQ